MCGRAQGRRRVDITKAEEELPHAVTVAILRVGDDVVESRYQTAAALPMPKDRKRPSTVDSHSIRKCMTRYVAGA